MKSTILSIWLLLMSVTNALSEWGEPVNMGPKINTSDHSERYPRLSFDGRILYFMSDEGVSQDIFYSIHDDTGWTQAQRMGPPINTVMYNEFAPMPSPDGLSLYFAALRPGGFGDWDIWVSHYDTLSGEWQDPYPIPPPVGSVETEGSPTLTEDGMHLYMYAAGVDPNPGPFMVSHWSDDSGWGPKIDTHIYLNAQSDPAITADGRELYFDRSRPNIGLRIYKSIKTGDCDTCWSEPELLPYPINDTISAEPYFCMADSRLYYVSATPEGGFPVDIWYCEYLSTGIENTKPENGDFEVMVNPNPFNAATTISYQLPTDSDVNLEIFNLLGQKIETLVDSPMEAGHHAAQWDASSFSSGIYFYKLTAGDKVFTKRMTLLK